MERGSHTRLCPGRATAWRAEDTEALVNCRAGGRRGDPARFLGSATGAVALQIVLVVLACCFSSLAKAQSLATSPEGSAYTFAASHCSIDGIDCITSYEADEAPLQICEDSSDPWNDPDDISLPGDDKAVIPSRDDQSTPQFTTTTLDAIALHQPGIIPAFLCPVQSSFSLREHLRERAPPFPV